jgi:hypothetical protein
MQLREVKEKESGQDSEGKEEPELDSLNTGLSHAWHKVYRTTLGGPSETLDLEKNQFASGSRSPVSIQIIVDDPSPLLHLANLFSFPVLSTLFPCLRAL